MAGVPSEDGLFLSATAMQWQALQKERATSVRSILKAVLNDDAYRERIPGAPPGSVLKRSLFAWCKDVGLGLHLHLEEAVSAGYLIQGGENPQEWLCVVPDWQPPIWEQGQVTLARSSPALITPSLNRSRNPKPKPKPQNLTLTLNPNPTPTLSHRRIPATTASTPRLGAKAGARGRA